MCQCVPTCCMANITSGWSKLNISADCSPHPLINLNKHGRMNKHISKVLTPYTTWLLHITQCGLILTPLPSSVKTFYKILKPDCHRVQYRWMLDGWMFNELRRVHGRQKWLWQVSVYFSYNNNINKNQVSYGQYVLWLFWIAALNNLIIYSLIKGERFYLPHCFSL